MLQNNLRVIKADTPELWETSVEIQRTVYCEERGFEDRLQHVNSVLFDKFDYSHSRRILVFAGDQPVATTRLILPGEYILPSIDLQPKLEPFLKEKSFAECSSFCSSKHLRAKAGVNDLRIRKHIVLLLIGALCELAKEHGVTHLTMLVEWSLIRRLRLLGCELVPVGEPVQHHGIRQACFWEFGNFLSTLRESSRTNWRIVTDNGNLSGFFENSDRIARTG